MAETYEGKSYLGVPLPKPRVAFFEFASCEGCQLQILNNEASLVDFLSFVEVVNFREAMTEKSDEYDIAFIEGAISSDEEKERIELIRQRAKVLIALGSCACFGGVNALKNRLDPYESAREVYGDFSIENKPSRPVHDFVSVDLKIFGCPVNKREVENVVLNTVLGKAVTFPKYPVCMECKANENICLFDLGEPCLGPVTRAGCDSWCPNNRFGCWGCRGPADDPNMEQLMTIMKERGFSKEIVLERLESFGGFAHILEDIKGKTGL